MRISSVQIFNIANNSMADANEAVVKTQEQLSTGRRVLNPSDDPVAATKIMSLRDELANVEQFQNNINAAKNNLVIEESVLSGVNNLVQRMQELAVQAGNTATLSTSEYESLANEVDSRLDELLNLLNSQNANGDYIFGGYKSSEEPFSGNASSGFRYNGDEGQQFMKIASSTTVSTSDSGKAIFVDIDSAENTATTYASDANLSNPPLQVSVATVTDQTTFNDFYPEDIVITFNADSNISPPGKNFTATERSSGRIIVENEIFVGGAPIELNGVSFKVTGDPISGEAAIEATRPFGNDSPVGTFDFTLANETFDIVVAGRRETFVLDRDITSPAILSLTLNDATNGNADRLANLGITVDSTGIRMPDGINVSVINGSANVDTVLGLDSINGSTSSDGVIATAGDRVFVDSSAKQDLLTTLAVFSEGMKAFDGSVESRELLKDTVSNTLANLDNAQTSVLKVMANIGARVNTLDSTEALLADSALVTREILSDLQDVDYAEAATRLASQTLILQAAQSSFVRVSQLTLFSLL